MNRRFDNLASVHVPLALFLASACQPPPSAAPVAPRPEARTTEPAATSDARASDARASLEPGGDSGGVRLKRQIALLTPEPVDAPVVRIEPAPARPLPPRAAVPATAACSRLFCNPELNSRFPATAAGRSWHVRWKVALDGYLAPHAVIQEGDRILIYGPRSYDLGFQLYDLEGKLRGQGAYPSRDPSGSTRPVVMDAAHQLVYLTDQYNRLIAHRMSDGKEEWNLGLDSLGGLWVRPFFARRGQRFVVLGLDKSEVLPDRIQAPPNQALLSQIDLSPTNQLTPDHAVLNVAALAKLYVNRGATVAAMHDDELVFAVPGRLYLASSDLRARVALEGEFVPEALTLDERGWMYLVVSTSGGRALWVVAPDGKRTIAESLDAPEALPPTPPIVGYDHTVYLQTSQTLSARDASGRVLWHKRMSARVAGAGVSTDDRLVAAVGSELLAVGTKGDAARLATPGPGDLVTAPVMSAAGEIFVASSDTLYCVSR